MNIWNKHFDEPIDFSPHYTKYPFQRHPIIAYVLLCEDQVECTACGISQMNQTRIETSNQRQPKDLKKNWIFEILSKYYHIEKTI